ncbi:reverse transcriptase domain-containing protein [Tanacetum coccineum]|uniref:Reverse transcriptase domain-containing protein n=1 Tax=Tanacetum coccineum TaxID=301880 RepID=A0ABQ5AFC6_9ASTR
MHLAASKESISVVLAAKRNEGWTPIYFISKVLQGAELNYPALEKLVLALVHETRRLQRYFQAYMITVLTNTSIKQMLTGPKKTRRVAKWAIELGEHDIVFLRKNEKETHVDFLVEIPLEDNKKEEKSKEVIDSYSKWRLSTDGASNSDGSRVGLMLIDPEDINKACPKDCYPLPEIDWKIESISGFCLKCFLDAYKGYHQIQIAEEDKDKTAFYTGEGVFCYKKMQFGLKNARATY